MKEDLNLQVSPKNIEAFDVSHLGGTNTVASMVSFINAKPRKTNYRKFNIKSTDKIDDFASIREVVSRRYTRLKKEKSQFPDLILIDGGKGQLNMATSALRDLGLDYIPVVGLAKRLEERDKSMVESPLLKIKGVGNKTVKKLFTEFDGLKDLANQKPENISDRIGISKELSKNIIKVSKSIQNK